jgi:3-methyladenine DNA glycosylase AlkD
MPAREIAGPPDPDGGVAAALRAAVVKRADPDEAQGRAALFGAGPGGYAEGDRFLGVRVPELRRVVRRWRTGASLADVRSLLADPWHEIRLLGGLLLVQLYEGGDADLRSDAVALLLHSTDRLDNWDLVDSTAPYVLGRWLVDRPDQRHLLDELAASELLWDRRMAMVATFALIRNGEFDDTIRLAESLVDDPHHLVHKATGWMLREVGARDRARLDAFLDAHGPRLPRTMLRYALEKHSPEERRVRMARPAS